MDNTQMGFVKVEIVGSSANGKSMRARDLDKANTTYNIMTSAFEECRVQKPDGEWTRGLEDGGIFIIKGTVKTDEVSNGGTVHLLQPTAAKQLQAEVIDFEAGLNDQRLEVKANSRGFRPLGALPVDGAQAEATPVAETQAVGAGSDDDIPPF